MRRIAVFFCAALFAAIPSATAQFATPETSASLSSLTGTYNFQLASLKEYSSEFNMNGQQVGFCDSGYLAVGYNCGDTYTFDMISGTIVADGAGHITSGTYLQTPDPNTYECDPNSNPTTPCPVVVPSGNAWSSTTAYSIGATVDYTVSGVTRTFQAVRKSTGKAPNWTTSAGQGNICSYNPNNTNTCIWTQIPGSLKGTDKSSTGTFTGTYTVNANGTGMITLQAANCTGKCSIQFSLLVPAVIPVGQSVNMVGISILGDHNRTVGSALRVK